jgi:hypothetical protein
VLGVAGGEVVHGLELRQDGASDTGLHRLAGGGTGPVKGRVEGDSVVLDSEHRTAAGGLSYRFSGALRGGALEGRAELGTAMAPGVGNLVNMREYGEASWRATRA